MEFASIYQRFGTTCTVVEMLDRVLPLEDDDVSVEMANATNSGVKIMTGTKLKARWSMVTKSSRPFMMVNEE